ncbi:MAG: hypothetical protein FJ028_05600 [Chloroflexi bacterium]|nr:hypothetical protein [Chloroflexota bacterium]
MNGALKRQAGHDRRMKALAEAVRGYEAEFGVIADEDIRSAERYCRSRAIRVAPGRPRRAKPARRAE